MDIPKRRTKRNVPRVHYNEDDDFVDSPNVNVPDYAQVYLCTFVYFCELRLSIPF